MRFVAIALTLLFSANAYALVDCRLRQFQTATERDARTDKDCTIGYAHDDDSFKIRANGSWSTLAAGNSVTGANGGTLVNAPNNNWVLSESDMALNIEFDTINNLASFLSGANIDSFFFQKPVYINGSLTLGGDGIIDQGAGDSIVFTDAGEDFSVTLSSNLATFASSTGATFEFTPAVAFTGDISLNGGAGAINFTSGTSSSVLLKDNTAASLIFGSTGLLNLLTLKTSDGTEKVMVTGTTGQVSLHNDVGTTLLDEAVSMGATLGVTGLTTATGGITTTKPLFLYDSIRFCGNGSNGNTAWYIGSISKNNGADNTTGSAACDGNDGAAAVASVPMPYVTYKVVGMMCATQAGGADDTNTFKLQTDADAGGGGAAADVAGMTCSVTNDGSLPKTCSVALAAPVSITAGAYMNIHNIQTDDDMSAKDVECLVYITY